MKYGNNKVVKLVFAALVGAIYAAITIAFAPISYGQLQVRVSEALTLLPFFSSYSVWGLFAGCIIANIFGGAGIIDVVFGSLATLVAASLTYYIGKSNLKYKRILAPMPPVVINAVVVGLILKITLHLPLVISMLWVGLGEFISCYVIGLMLLSVVEKNRKLMEYLRA
jgi:uncharacterized membrane protein